MYVLVLFDVLVILILVLSLLLCTRSVKAGAHLQSVSEFMCVCAIIYLHEENIQNTKNLLECLSCCFQYTESGFRFINVS